MRAAAVVIAIAIAIVVAGCTSGSETARGPTTVPLREGEGRSVIVGSTTLCSPPESIPLGDVGSRLPAGLSLPPGARLLEVKEVDGTISVSGETQMGVADLQAFFRDQLTAAGYPIHREDNEGIEAELYFGLPDGRVGVVQERVARCPKGTTRFSITLAR